MEMCHSAGLYQIDLLNGSKTRVTEREYWVKKKGQLALDDKNAALVEQGLPVKQSKFETDKDELRQEIHSALSDATNFEDFTERLLRRGITVKESRGRLSYLTPTEPNLSPHESWVTILTRLLFLPHLIKMHRGQKCQSHRNTHHRPLKIVFSSRILSAVWWILKPNEPRARGRNISTGRSSTNLKNGSKAFMMYKDMGFESPEELNAAYQEAHEKMTATLAKLKSIEAAIAEKKELRTHVLSYFKTKDIREGLKACKNEKARCAYREEHDSELYHSGCRQAIF